MDTKICSKSIKPLVKKEMHSIHDSDDLLTGKKGNERR